VLLSGLLAMGRAPGREGLTRALLAGGIILAPQLGATSTLLSAPDHTGTAVPVLLAWLVIDRNPRGRAARRRWLVPAAVCVILTLATVSDSLVLVVGIVPLAAACGLRLVRKVAAPRWYEAWLAAAAAVAGVLGLAIPPVIRALGGYREAHASTRTAGLGHLGHAAWVAVQGTLELFGANVISARPGLDFAFTVLRLAGVIMVALAFGLAAARFSRPQELLIPAFALAITLSLAAYMVSAYGQRTDTRT
jgi:hypothetical protein